MDEIKKQIMDIYKGIVSDLYKYKISIPVKIDIAQNESEYVRVTVWTLGNSEQLYCRKYFVLSSTDELSTDDIARVNVELRRAFSEILSEVLSIK